MEEVYRYNRKIWRPQPTTHDGDSLFHAAFGEGNPYIDNDASFRRKCLVSLFTHFECEEKPESFKVLLENLVEPKPNAISDMSHYNAYAKEFLSSQRAILTKEIPLVAAMDNTRVVVFVEDEEEPRIFNPNEQLVGNFPYRLQKDFKEVVLSFKGNVYTRLQCDNHEAFVDDQSLEDSVEDEEESENCAKTDHLKVDSNGNFDTRHQGSNHLDEEPIIMETEEDEKEADFTKTSYTKLSSAASLKGILYQINLLTIFLLNGKHFDDDWRMSTENEDAGKFDDLVLEMISKFAILLQAKHKQNKKITSADLLSTNKQNDFSLPKYYLSYQELKKNFKVKHLILCTNTSLPNQFRYKENVDSKSLIFKLFHHSNITENCCYTFSKSIIPQLREKIEQYMNKHFKNTNFEANILQDDQLLEFLSLFQLITRFPSKSDLNSVIENILSKAEYCNESDAKDCSRFLNDKMIEWYDSKSAKYLTKHTVTIFLNEFRSHKLCEKLRNNKIQIRNIDFDYTKAKRLLHIESRWIWLMSMIKIYSALETSSAKCLFLGSEEDFNIQMEMIHTFETSEYDTLVAFFGVSDAACIDGLSSRLTFILRNDEKKKLILITDRCDSLSTSMKRKNADLYQHIFENIPITDLTEESQDVLRKIAALII